MQRKDYPTEEFILYLNIGEYTSMLGAIEKDIKYIEDKDPEFAPDYPWDKNKKSLASAKDKLRKAAEKITDELGRGLFIDLED